MTMIPVNSSAIKAVGYDGNTLYIEFHSGRIDPYPHTPPHIYLELMLASSKGRYYRENIRISQH